MIEETRLEDAYLELEGGIEGASRMGVLWLNQDEYGSVKLSPRTQYDLLEFLYQRRYALYRCYLNEVDPPHAGYELWNIDNQRAHREIWDNDEPWVEPQSMTYPYAIPAWVQDAIIRVNLLRTTWVTQAEFLAVLQMCNPA